MQRATTNHNNPQLRHKMNETHKKLHSLAYVLSSLNPLAHPVAFRLLVHIQCSGIILFVVEAFRSVFVRVILRTWQLKD